MHTSLAAVHGTEVGCTDTRSLRLQRWTSDVWAPSTTPSLLAEVTSSLTRLLSTSAWRLFCEIGRRAVLVPGGMAGNSLGR
jgi:hypothetical protein